MIGSYAARRVGALCTPPLLWFGMVPARAVDMTDVVVSATRTERSIDLVPSDVTVLSAEAGIYGGRV